MPPSHKQRQLLMCAALLVPTEVGRDQAKAAHDSEEQCADISL